MLSDALRRSTRLNPPLATAGDAASGLVHDGWEWTIPKAAPNPQQAAERIGWLMRPAQLTQWDLGSGATPTTHAVLQESAS